MSPRHRHRAKAISCFFSYNSYYQKSLSCVFCSGPFLLPWTSDAEIGATIGCSRQASLGGVCWQDILSYLLSGGKLSQDPKTRPFGEPGIKRHSRFPSYWNCTPSGFFDNTIAFESTDAAVKMVLEFQQLCELLSRLDFQCTFWNTNVQVQNLWIWLKLTQECQFLYILDEHWFFGVSNWLYICCSEAKTHAIYS